VGLVRRCLSTKRPMRWLSATTPTCAAQTVITTESWATVSKLPGNVLGVVKALSQSPGSTASWLDVSRNSCDEAHGKRISSTESCRGGVTHPFSPPA
jgi:hypothetical protein